MSDQRIQYDEEMVGAGHPTKSDTLNRIMLVDHENDGSHRYLGLRRGMDFEYASASSISMAAGFVEINGQVCTLEAAATLTLSGISASEKRFLYFSVPSRGTTLSASEFSHSTTAPSRDHAKGGGWYDASGDKRCVGWIPVDDSGDLRPVRVAGGWMYFEDGYFMLTTNSPATSFTAYSLGAGAAGLGVVTKALVRAQVYHVSTASVTMQVRSGGASISDTTYTNIAQQHAAGAAGRGEGVYQTNASDQLEYMATSGSTIAWWLKAVEMVI